MLGEFHLLMLSNIEITEFKLNGQLPEPKILHSKCRYAVKLYAELYDAVVH